MERKICVHYVKKYLEKVMTNGLDWLTLLRTILSKSFWMKKHMKNLLPIVQLLVSNSLQIIKSKPLSEMKLTNV